MSSIPPATTEPNSPQTSVPLSPSPVLGPVAPVETAPSAMVSEASTFARVIGFIGLFCTVLGLVVVITTRVTGTPRFVPEWLGYIFTAFGPVSMLCHAIMDREQEIRRMYGILAAALLLAAVVMAVVPGPSGDAGITKHTGYYFMPWGRPHAVLTLLFVVPFSGTKQKKRTQILLYALLLIGVVLCLSAVGLVSRSTFPLGTWVALALLGAGFLAAFLSQTDSSEGLRLLVAFGINVYGAAALLLAFGWAVSPTVLYDGPRVLRKSKSNLREVGRCVPRTGDPHCFWESRLWGC